MSLCRARAARIRRLLSDLALTLRASTSSRSISPIASVTIAAVWIRGLHRRTSLSAVVVQRGDDALGLEVLALDHPDHVQGKVPALGLLPIPIVILELDLELDPVSRQRDHLCQGRDLLARESGAEFLADIRATDLVERHRADLRGNTRDAHQVAVMIEDDHTVSGLLDVDLGVIGAHLDGLLDRASAVFGGNLGEPLVSRHDHVPGCTKPLEHADAQAHEYDQRSQSSELPVAQERCDPRASRAWSVSMGADSGPTTPRARLRSRYSRRIRRQ